MTSIAVVTGAGRGIGLRFAHRLADQGHRVILTDIDGDAAAHAAAEIGRDAVGIAQDVRDLGSHRDVADRARDLGRLAVWVNNAGILIAGDSWEHDDDQVQAILDVNLRGPIGGSAAAVNAMGARGGAILNVASLSALSPVPGLAIYAATKAAVLSYTTSLQGDLNHAGLPIRASAVPGRGPHRDGHGAGEGRRRRPALRRPQTPRRGRRGGLRTSTPAVAPDIPRRAALARRPRPHLRCRTVRGAPCAGRDAARRSSAAARLRAP